MQPVKPILPQTRHGMTKLGFLCFAAVVALLLAAVAVPNFARSRVTRSKHTCPDYMLPALEKAKLEWARQFGKQAGDTPQISDLLPLLPRNQLIPCPSGGTYTIGAVGEKPRCSDSYHTAVFLEGK